ncbi:MAG: PQQ-binding-like beta-propeller repeat protein [Halobacteriota archaeon]
MRKITKIFGIIAILVFLTGIAQAGDWPMFHHDARHTGYTDDTIPDNLELLWSYETGNCVDSSPAVANGKVFVGSDDHKIYCLNENTGELIWSYEIGNFVFSSPAVANGKVFVGSDDHKIYCLNENTGELIWSYETGNYVDSSPAVANGKVFIGSADHKLYCLDEDDGSLIWSYETGNTMSSPAVANGKVFVGSCDDHKLYCLDEDNGELIWSYKTGGLVVSSPAVANGKVFVGSHADKIYCLDENTGNLIWRYETGDDVHSSPAVANGKVFVGSDDDKIYCLDEDNGNLIWSYKAEHHVFSSPAVADGKVFVGSMGMGLYCLDANNGNLIWSYETGDGVLSSPAVANGKVFVGSSDDRIYCFGVKSTPTAAPTEAPTPTPRPPVEAPTEAPKETPTPTPSPFASIPPLYILGAAAIIVIILIAGIGISRKGKGGESKKQPPAEPPKPKPAKQEPIIKKEAPPPISESLTIERAIYDPCKRDFIEGRLPRMKEWVNSHDPGAYWFAMSIQNNTDRAIEEWDVDLDFSSALKIEEAKIEGIEIEIPHEAHLKSFKISVPKEYGIVIPKGGTQRVYFKLRADKPKTTYEISGIFKSEITGNVPIRAKEFKYLCDTGVSPEAVKTELKKTFSEKEAARLALSFKTVQELDRMCSQDAKTEEYLDKLSVLKNYTEGFSDTFTTQVDEFSRFMEEEQSGYLDDEYKGKVRRFCTNLVDVWISEFLKG